jgi:endonuclease YncB( thermonuclease family)
MSYRITLTLSLAAALVLLGLWLLAAPKPPTPVAVALAPIVSTPAPPVPAPAALPPPQALPALPQVQVAAQPEHAPPPDTGPVAAGRPLDLRGFDAKAPASSTSSAPAEARTGHAPSDFAGPGRVTSATGLIVGRIPVELFGIRHSAEGDRCGDMDCEQAAMAALTAKLNRGRVSCHSPVPNKGVVAFAICLDSDGVDLGGMLVGDGLALANRRESSDYAGAEGVAHDLRHGLWQSR